MPGIQGILWAGWWWALLEHAHASQLSEQYPDDTRVLAEPEPEEAERDYGSGQTVAVLAQLVAPLPALADRQAIEANTLVVISAQFRLLAHGDFASVQVVKALPAASKLAPALRGALAAGLRRPFLVTVRTLGAPIAALGSLPGELQLPPPPELPEGAREVHFLARASQALALASRPAVVSVRPTLVPMSTSWAAGGVVHAGAIGTAGAVGLAPYTGVGARIALVDTGMGGYPHDVPSDLSTALESVVALPVCAPWTTYQDHGPDAPIDPSPMDGPAASPGEYVGHGTALAGILVGSGAGLAEARGIAPGAKLRVKAAGHRLRWLPNSSPPFGWPPEEYGLYGLPGTVNLATTLNEAIAAPTAGGLPSNLLLLPFSLQEDEDPDYLTECTTIDEFCWRTDDVMVVVPAGNLGRNETWPATGPGTAVAPATAKNVLAVGATENNRPGARWVPSGSSTAEGIPEWMDVPEAYQTFGDVAGYGASADNPGSVVPYSGRGPVCGGRRKPEVVAPGHMIMAVRSPDLADLDVDRVDGHPAYGWVRGTSAAAAVATGLLALYHELCVSRLARVPSSSLLKAMAVAGASPLGGVNDAAGFGRMDAAPFAGDFVAVERERLADGRTWTATYTATATRVVVAMVWMDAPGRSLVNKLQLRRRTLGGVEYADGDAVSVTNNSQRLELTCGLGEEVKVEVYGLLVAQGRPTLGGAVEQDFALVVLGAS